MTKKLYFITTIIAMLIFGGCNISYKWKGYVDMPSVLSKENQLKIAQCILTKYNIPEFKSQLYKKFTNMPKQQIDTLTLEIIDGGQIDDFYPKEICIEITIPSTMGAFRKPNPIVEYLKLKIKEEIPICVKEINKQ